MTNKKLNILQIINEPWTSGISEYGLILSKGLMKKGHKVIIAGLKGTPVEDGAKKSGIQYEILNNINRLSPLSIYCSVRQINNILKNENIDVINTHRAEGQSLGYISNKLAGNKAVLIRTRGDQRAAKNNLLNRWLYRNLTDRIIVASRMAKKYHFSGFAIDNRISVIPSAVDTEIFNPRVKGEAFRINYGIKKDEFLVGIIARLDPVKGHYYFLEAARFLKDILPAVKFVIVGREENTKLSGLKKAAVEFGLEKRVIFTGFYKNIAEAAAGFDIGVIASIGSEAISRVCLEMMACGKPVVASKVGSIPELITDGVTGLLYAPKDSKMLSEHIKKLISDTELMKKIGNSAYSSVMDKYSVDTFTGNTENLYFEALEEKWKKSL